METEEACIDFGKTKDVYESTRDQWHRPRPKTCYSQRSRASNEVMLATLDTYRLSHLCKHQHLPLNICIHTSPAQGTLPSNSIYTR